MKIGSSKKKLPRDTWNEKQPVVILTQCPTCGHREVTETQAGLMYPADPTRLRDVVLSRDDAKFLMTKLRRR